VALKCESLTNMRTIGLVGIYFLVLAFDSNVGPGQLIGLSNRVYAPIFERQLHVGMSRDQFHSAARSVDQVVLGDGVRFPTRSAPNRQATKDGVIVDFAHSFMPCFWTYHRVTASFDPVTDRLSKWSVYDGFEGC
jgi:hypothetical protein